MPRSQTIYQSEAVYVGPTGAFAVTGRMFTTGNYGLSGQQALSTSLVAELYRVQNVSHNYSLERTDVLQLGELARIDSIQLGQPSVSVQFDYLLANLYNEHAMGMTVASNILGNPDVSCLSGILTNTTDGKNLFIRNVPVGQDVKGLANTTANQYTIAVGNAFLASYSMTARVGEFPTASVTWEGLNYEVENGVTNVNSPAVDANGAGLTGWFATLPVGTQSIGGNTINANDRSLSVLRPGDIVVDLGGSSEIECDFSDLKVQDVSISFDFNREDIEKLGSKYAVSKEITPPINVSLTVNAIVGDSVTGSLIEILNNNLTYAPVVTLYKPGTSTIIARYKIAGAKLDSHDYSIGVDDRKNVSLTYSAQIGGPNDTTAGLYLSGVI